MGVSAYVGAASQMDGVAWSVALLLMPTGPLCKVASRVRHGSGKCDGHAHHGRSKSVPLGWFLSAVEFATLRSRWARNSGCFAAAPRLCWRSSFVHGS